MEIRPDKKLKTKQWYVLLTISLLILITGLLFQIFLPLKEGVTSREVSIILWPIIAGTILLMLVISVPIIILWINNLSYFIEDDRITIYKGILTKIQQNIPYRAITDFQLHRTLYDRFLGIGSIRIQTAGQSQSGTGYEGKLSGLITWEDLHAQLKSKIKNLHPLSESTTVQEKMQSPIQEDSLDLILKELKAIRKAIEKNQ